MRLKRHSSEQKLRGAYYTPKDLALEIVRLSHAESARRILEPSCGDGVFLEALRDSVVFERDVNIDATEIDADALEKAGDVSCGDANLTLALLDFFEFYERAEPGSYDLVLGNPPYIRYQYLKPEQRELLADILHRQGMRANKLVNAWVGFMVACTDLLADDGILAFVVPAEILQVGYAEDLRRFLAQRYERITLLAFDKLIFDDVEQETVVFIGEKGCNREEGFIRVVEVGDIEDLTGTNVEAIEYQPFVPNDEKWTRYFVNPRDARTLNSLAMDDRLVPLSSLAKINVGVTTGNNAYFSITDETSHSFDLDSLTLPLIGRSSHASGVFFTESDWMRNRANGKRARLLALEDNQYEMLNSAQQSYIDYGEENGENAGYKCSIRDSWYAVPSIWIPDAFFLRRNNMYPKFVLNRCGAISTDTMHRMKFEADVDPELVLLSYYNSIAFAYTELCGRSYGGGVLEILPKEVGNILVLDPAKISIDSGVKDSVITSIDSVVRGNKGIETALDIVDDEILVGQLGFDKRTCDACRRVWKTLQSRRLSRSTR